ncbi:MAG: hypothetical protein LUE90_06725 [Clostridiales bacterium]|nr:hypothetical protein [Clostridiales bacterium]
MGCTITGGQYAAGVAAYRYNSNVGLYTGCLVEDCTITVYSESTSVRAAVGGIAGQHRGYVKNCSVVGCTIGSTSASGLTEAGGLIGVNYYSTTTADSQVMDVENCSVADCDIYGTSAGGAAGKAVGVTFRYISVTDTDVAAQDTSGTGADAYAGGLAGYYQQSRYSTASYRYGRVSGFAFTGTVTASGGSGGDTYASGLFYFDPGVQYYAATTTSSVNYFNSQKIPVALGGTVYTTTAAEGTPTVENAASSTYQPTVENIILAATSISSSGYVEPVAYHAMQDQCFQEYAIVSGSDYGFVDTTDYTGEAESTYAGTITNLYLYNGTSITGTAGSSTFSGKTVGLTSSETTDGTTVTAGDFYLYGAEYVDGYSDTTQKNSDVTYTLGQSVLWSNVLATYWTSYDNATYGYVPYVTNSYSTVLPGQLGSGVSMYASDGTTLLEEVYLAANNVTARKLPLFVDLAAGNSLASLSLAASATAAELPDVAVYASGGDILNIEFDSENLPYGESTAASAEVWFTLTDADGDPVTLTGEDAPELTDVVVGVSTDAGVTTYEYEEGYYVTSRVLSMYYDYAADFTLTVYTWDEDGDIMSEAYAVDADSLAVSVSTWDDYWAYIGTDGTTVTMGSGTTVYDDGYDLGSTGETFVNLYAGCALTSEGRVLDVETGTWTAAGTSCQVLSEAVPLCTGTSYGYTIDTFATFTYTRDAGYVSNLMMVSRNGLMLTVSFDDGVAIQRNGMVVDYVSETAYMTVLNTETGKLLDYGTELNTPSGFSNSGIAQISNNLLNSSTNHILMGKTTGGGIWAFDYVTGESIDLGEAAESTVTLFSYVQSVASSLFSLRSSSAVNYSSVAATAASLEEYLEESTAAVDDESETAASDGGAAVSAADESGTTDESGAAASGSSIAAAAEEGSAASESGEAAAAEEGTEAVSDGSTATDSDNMIIVASESSEEAAADESSESVTSNGTASDDSSENTENTDDGSASEDGTENTATGSTGSAANTNTAVSAVYNASTGEYEYYTAEELLTGAFEETESLADRYPDYVAGEITADSGSENSGMALRLILILFAGVAVLTLTLYFTQTYRRKKRQ